MIMMLILHLKALKAGLSNAMLALMLGNLSETHQTIFLLNYEYQVKNWGEKYKNLYVLQCIYFGFRSIRLCFHATSIYSQFFFLICPSHSTPTQSDI